MLRRGPYMTNAAALLGDRQETRSPYRHLEESPSRKVNKASFNAESLRGNIGQNINQDFSRRLEEIKRKYSSLPKGPRNSTALNINNDPIGFPRKSTIVNENLIRAKLEMTPSKTIPDIPKPVPFGQTRQPFQNIISSHQTQRNSICCKETNSTNPKFEERGVIFSIDKINQKIKNILEGINPGNTSTRLNSEGLREELQSSFKDPTQTFRDTTSSKIDKGNTTTFTAKRYSVERDSRSGSVSKNYNQPMSYRENRVYPRDYDNRLLEIQETMKKSESNRVNMARTYKPPIQPLEEVKRQDIYPTVETSQTATFNSTLNSLKFTQFGTSGCRNILDELKAFEKTADVTGKEVQVAPVKQETNRLTEVLVSQVKWDEEFRNGKIWLQSSIDTNKWNHLKDILSRKEGKPKTEEEIKAIFVCSQDDHNPFFTAQPSQSLEGVVDKYVAANQHWKAKIMKRFSCEKLKQEGFGLEVLDLERKGHIQVQDVVRYLNIESGKFYRNRDLTVIFKRMTRGNRLTFQEFLQSISGSS